MPRHRSGDRLRRLVRRAGGDRASRRVHPERTARARPGVDARSRLASETAPRDVRAMAVAVRSGVSRRNRRFDCGAELAVALPNRADRLTVRALAAHDLAHRAAVAAADGGARARRCTRHDIAADCRRVTAPTLVVTGEPALDRVVPVEGTTPYAHADSRRQARRPRTHGPSRHDHPSGGVRRRRQRVRQSSG